MTLIFRCHDQAPSQTTSTSTLLRRLLDEWVEVHTCATTPVAMRHWGTREPVLAGHTRPGDVVDAIDAADAEGTDALLLALVRLAQDGSQLAGRILLQAMLPKLWSLPGRLADDSDRSAVIAEFWMVVHRHRVATCTRKVAANLALNTLKAWCQTATGDRRGFRQVPADPCDLPALSEALPDDETTSDPTGTQALQAATTATLTTILAATDPTDVPGLVDAGGPTGTQALQAAKASALLALSASPGDVVLPQALVRASTRAMVDWAKSEGHISTTQHQILVLRYLGSGPGQEPLGLRGAAAALGLTTTQVTTQDCKARARIRAAIQALTTGTAQAAA